MGTFNFENHFRDLFENTNDLIFFLKINGEIELANPATLITLGYDLNELKGHNILHFIHPDCKERYHQHRMEVIRSKELKSMELCFITKKNELIYGEVQVSCSYKLGKPQYTRGVFKNTTLRQKAEKKILESEKRLKAFLNANPDAIIIINEQQEILEWNPRAEAIFGFSANEIYGKSLEETIIPPKYREAHAKGLQHFLKTNEGPVLNRTIEITALKKNGQEFHINLSISNVKLEEYWIFIAFISDISQRKETEAALILKEGELIQSKMLQEEKDQFISIAGHELRTPITTIKAYGELAYEICHESNALLKNYLAKINQNTTKITFLLNELLDVSKINLGKLHLSLKKLDYKIYLAETLNSIQQITPTHQIVLEENESTFINVDPIRLEQVIINLVSNSVKYSPGKNKILVQSELKNNELHTSFTDYGIGISEEEIPKIFNRFYRVNEFSNKFEGLGIGLYISSEIIKHHGGNMWVESVQGKGSTFHYSLPL